MENGALLSKMYLKPKALAMNSENLEKIYIIETNIVSRSKAVRATEKKGGKK
jgi:hypothetical protein